MADELKAEKQPEKTPVQRLQEFLEKEGLTITAIPQFVATNHGSFEVTVTVGIQKKK